MKKMTAKEWANKIKEINEKHFKKHDLKMFIDENGRMKIESTKIFTDQILLAKEYKEKTPIVETLSKKVNDFFNED